MLALAGLAIIALAAPQVAGAASSAYPNPGQARSFATSDGGWHSSTSFAGLCVPGISCPTVSNGYAANGGTGGHGDGYLRTAIGSLLGVGATSRGIYTSPAFTYSGAGGATPTSLTLDIKRRSSLGQLLAVTGNSADYSVDLVDLTHGGSATGVIDNEPIGDQSSWLARSASVAPGSLTVGDQYRVRITSEFKTGVQVVPGGSVGYDDVVLKAKVKGHGHHHGGDGNHRLHHQVSHGIGVAHLTRHGLTFKARCPGSARPHKCAMRLSALLSKKGHEITNTRKATLGAAKTRRIRLHLKHGYAKRVHHHNRIAIKARVKVGDHHTVVIKSVRIVKH
ncbi:MAG: hypothetical protein ACRDLL_09275 [Solirubrobacterales bacterium]